MKRKRHPFPQMARERFRLLDGVWRYREDGAGIGESAGWPAGFDSDRSIVVPFACESAASGVGRECAPGRVWYCRTFEAGGEELSGSALLWFEGVDYTAKVWVNGRLAGSHDGAYTAFCFDVAALLREGKNTLVVMAEDGYRLENPRGKQRWLDKSYSCWYVPTTGIWKSVFVEFTGKTHLDRIKLTPNVSDQTLEAEFFFSGYRPGLTLEFSVSRAGREQKRVTLEIDSPYAALTLDMGCSAEEFQVRYWTTDAPDLYDAVVTLRDGERAEDRVRTYFGFREFRAEKGCLTLNGAPIYQKLALYQGYWSETGLTPPSNEAVEKDLTDVKRMGFNGIRVHQKIESEYFLYCADKIGLLVWCEMPSAHAFNDDMKGKVACEWTEILRQKYNHPSIVTWVPFNESWGVRGIRQNRGMQSFADAIYHLTKAYDGMRPVVTNDGWEHVKTDLITVHNYEQNPELLSRAYRDEASVLAGGEATRHQKLIFAEGYAYEGQPVLVSEYGGIAFMNGLSGDDWGYSAVATEDDFCARFQALCAAIKRIGYVVGYCYTQFSDVWQEKNGLVTMDRKYKVDPAKIKKINDESCWD